MTRTLLAITALLLAGCSAPATDLPANLAVAALTDSEPVRSTYDLSAGIDRSWHFTVGEPATDSGRLTFSLFGPSGAPARMDALCLEYAYEQHTPTGLRETEGSRGTCGSGAFVSPELALEGDAVFLLEGAEVLPGTYSFQAAGGPQLASLVVELVAR